MSVRDRHGLELSGASPAAAEGYLAALGAYHRYAGEPVPALYKAATDSPGFVMAHVLLADMTLVGSNPKVRKMGLDALARARDLPATPREAAHRQAAEALAVGEIRRAGRILADVSAEHPTDVLALQVGQLTDFLSGDAAMLRDRIARAATAWSDGMPDHHAVLAMLAFGLEESGRYAEAEAAGRRAIELERRNAWAQHAVAHVLEMQGRRAEGVAWMREDVGRWTEQSFLAIHNWWHLALFHLGLGETDEVLALWDAQIFGDGLDMAFDLDDAAALLWRLKLRGVDGGDRWGRLADAYALLPRGQAAFDDMHAAMAFVGAGREDEALAVVAAQADGIGDNAANAREIGAPIAQAIVDFGRGRFGEAAEGLRTALPIAHRFGGSHAQRNVIDLTLRSAEVGGTEPFPS